MNTFSIDPSILAAAEEYVDQSEDELELEKETPTKSFAKALAKPVQKAKAVVATAKEKTKRVNTKTARALEIFKQSNGDKKSTIEAYMSELKMSKAGATTYFYNAKKAA